ncbi:Wall-associated receptor kinase [Parasponia andersonii]|uniref:Wall-associated receptor kinase n=1 Tax=Parasponia andersonii TaxID=3476 RepID=A0A2P5BNC4_PARAD|nr:Wall-associated receptor kinase [Parasponia andersonii]
MGLREILSHSSVVLVVMGMVIGSYASSSTASSVALPGCADHCGSLTVPYPFGIGDGCHSEEKFNITCESSVAYLFGRQSNIKVTNISLNDGEMQIWQYVGRDCYNPDGQQNRTMAQLSFAHNFTISSTKNKFTAVGCDTYALIQGYRNDRERYTTGCMSLCDDFSSISYESCSGAGCCEISIPSGLISRTVTLSSYNNHRYVRDFNPCSYAFTVETSGFKFSNTTFEYLKTIDQLPIIIDWSIGNVSCDEAKKFGDLKCKANSECVNSKTRSGHLCKCLRGFEGNPYHPHGCQDVNECNNSSLCANGICNNIAGKYTCTCPEQYVLNGTICSEVPVTNSIDRSRRALFIYIPLSVGIAFVAFAVASLVLCWGIKRRKLMKLKEKFFEQNGGFMLQQQLSSRRGSFETTRIFTAEELERATNNYDESRVVGEGGYGTVYKGILMDGKVVAIKKPKVNAQIQTEQFINEMIVLMQINHRNVVRLLGCCLETEVPLLVYEFITNGTLFQLIHNKGTHVPSLSWELRLKIAAETAGALAYLHSETIMPIIHRDVKTMNILLDENHTAKVSDFGTSRLVPLDEIQMTTLVQGTIGYLDPEYLQSSQLTEKSDVYSFGVVLAELLTGKKALSFDKSDGVSNLAMFFVSLMEDDHLLRIIDDEIVSDEHLEALKEVANLTRRCLRIKGEERPTMKEVAMELEGLRTLQKHPWGSKVDLCSEETEYLLQQHSSPYAIDIESGSRTGSAIVGYDSIQNQLLMPYNGGR